MGKASDVRVAILNREITGLSDKQIAENCQTSLANVRMVKNRLKKPLRERSLEDRCRWLEERVRALEQVEALRRQAQHGNVTALFSARSETIS